MLNFSILIKIYVKCRKIYLTELEVICSLMIDFDDTARVSRKPKITDIEVFALKFNTEYMTIDSKNDWFKQLPNLIERSQFNKRRGKVFEFLETIRTTLTSSFLKLAKTIGLTLVQYINKFIFERPINNIKIQIN